MIKFFELIDRGRDQKDDRVVPKPLDLPLIIGGGAGSNIAIAGLPDRTLLIDEYQGHLFLQPLVTDPPILHNNRKISASVWLKSGDTVRIDDTLLEFEISGELLTIKTGTYHDAMPSLPPRNPPEPEGDKMVGTGTPPSLPYEDHNLYESKRLPLYQKIALPILFILLLCAGYLLMAVVTEISIMPEPDSIQLLGNLPAISLGLQNQQVKGDASGKDSPVSVYRFMAMPGDYILMAKKEGYHPLEQKITIASSSDHPLFKLDPLPGILQITSEPDGAEVFLDGNPVGRTPLKSLTVKQGSHEMEISLYNYRPVKRSVVVEGFGKWDQIHFKLEPAWGVVKLQSVPPGAAIFLDGVEQDEKTPAELRIPEGVHTISLMLQGYRKAEIPLTVVAGQIHEITPVTLQPAPAILNLRTVPAGALISVDSVYSGKSPVRIELDPGRSHKLTALLPGYAAHTVVIQPGEPGQQKNLEIRLKPKYAKLFIKLFPEKASLFLNGKVQKRSSGWFTLLAKPHTVEARAPGYLTKKITVDLSTAHEQRIDLRLRRQGQRKKTDEGSQAKGKETATMKLLYPKSFLMGSSRREQGRRTNEIQHKVLMSRPFLIGVREVTNGEFRRFRPSHSSGSFMGRSLDGDNQPVINVSWDLAARYCNWLSDQAGLPRFYLEKGGRMVPVSVPNTGYRLPTEAEWAYAARMAGRVSAAKYAWSGSFPPPDRAGNFADESARNILSSVIAGYNDSYPVSSPAGSFRPDPAGLYDIGGNVSEWCNDYYSPVPQSAQKSDPMGPATGTHRVVRGANWRSSTITELRLSYRGYSRKPSDTIGFRVARYPNIQDKRTRLVIKQVTKGL